jgi:branched-chain amino acid transport system ATP-binding protein
MDLDPMTLKQVFETIKLMHSSGRTILLVEQNVRAGLGVATRGVSWKVARSGSRVHIRKSSEIPRSDIFISVEPFLELEYLWN